MARERRGAVSSVASTETLYYITRQYIKKNETLLSRKLKFYLSWGFYEWFSKLILVHSLLHWFQVISQSMNGAFSNTLLKGVQNTKVTKGF